MTSTAQTVCTVVKKVRQFVPRWGSKKLYDITMDALQQRGIKLGRDRFHEILKRGQLLVPRRKRHFFTTDSKHRFYKYPNIAQDLEVKRPEQLWVSDITYIKTGEGPMYLSLVTDAYSRMIMGYHLADHLKARGPIEALRMALKNRRYPGRKLMHHSDKGLQYCCDEYIDLLNQNNVAVSMTSKYDPYENAIAERVNGTIKNEFEMDLYLPTKQFAMREINRVIKIYNKLRPHMSCSMCSPEGIHAGQNPYSIKLNMRKQWSEIIFDNLNKI